MSNVEINLFPTLAKLITVWIGTGILFFFFKKFFWNSLMDFLQRREEYILNQVESASTSNKKAVEFEQQANEALKQARIDSKSILDKSKDEAIKIKEDILNKAQNEATDKMEKARIEIEREKASAQKEVEGQVVDIAMDVARKIVKGNIDEQKSENIVQDFIKELNE
ncbi:F0F1 ATP synthase subunit B [Mycoplasma sp. P36-A1]|uniref:F0F1 ATP synthase subunit B n=1 Tax=Mycoplasma sp. P36-A1 TaxID=3252900 RepID=UPI003C2F9B2C